MNVSQPTLKKWSVKARVYIYIFFYIILYYIIMLQVHLYSPKKELQLVKGHENPCVSPFKKMICWHSTGVSVDELQMCLRGPFRLRASGAYRCLASPTLAKGDAKGFTGDMDKMPSRCLYATDSTGRLLYCGVYFPCWCPKVSKFLHVCCIWLQPTWISRLWSHEVFTWDENPNLHPLTNQWFREGCLETALRQTTIAMQCLSFAK